MGAQPIRSTLVAVVLAAVTSIGLPPAPVTAQDHPQEVLDLIAAHKELAMKIRPLRDRVIALAPVYEKTEGASLRAQSSDETRRSNPAADRRVSETLRNRDRAVLGSDEYDRIEGRLADLEEKAEEELGRISIPGFGLRSLQRNRQSGETRFGDGAQGARPPSDATDQPELRVGGNTDNEAIADARRALAALERELTALIRGVDALEAQ
jgi:hypothetical protein